MVSPKLLILSVSYCVWASWPIASMYGIFTTMYHKKQPNVIPVPWIGWVNMSKFMILYHAPWKHDNMLYLFSPLGQLFSLLSCCHFPSWCHFMIYTQIQASSGQKKHPQVTWSISHPESWLMTYDSIQNLAKRTDDTEMSPLLRWCEKWWCEKSFALNRCGFGSGSLGSAIVQLKFTKGHSGRQKRGWLV